MAMMLQGSGAGLQQQMVQQQQQPPPAAQQQQQLLYNSQQQQPYSAPQSQAAPYVQQQSAAGRLHVPLNQQQGGGVAAAGMQYGMMQQQQVYQPPPAGVYPASKLSRAAGGSVDMSMQVGGGDLQPSLPEGMLLRQQQLPPPQMPQQPRFVPQELPPASVPPLLQGRMGSGSASGSTAVPNGMLPPSSLAASARMHRLAPADMQQQLAQPMLCMMPPAPMVPQLGRDVGQLGMMQHAPPAPAHLQQQQQMPPMLAQPQQPQQQQQGGMYQGPQQQQWGAEELRQLLELLGETVGSNEGAQGMVPHQPRPQHNQQAVLAALAPASRQVCHLDYQPSTSDEEVVEQANNGTGRLLAAT